MIKRKKKVCKECDKLTYLFSKGRCKSCASKSYKSAQSKVTTAQQQINSQLKQTYKLIDSVRPQMCESCGSTSRPLSHSHTISVGRCKRIGKPELISDEGNIVLECFGASGYCHEIWEHGSLAQQKQLRTFEQKVAYIKEHDPELYQRRFAEN